MPLPKPQKIAYNQSIPGIFGKFGAGGGLQAFYIQSTIQPSQLDNISLISEINGSEKWPIQDLFQRDVDDERITSGLLPYLEDQKRIKFFNPLTLTVLPMRQDGHTVLKRMPKIVQGTKIENAQEWTTFEREGFFRVRWLDDEDSYGRLEWNDKTSKLVAIDGQHRLSALKRMFEHRTSRAHDDYIEWRIPIVVVSFRAVDSAEPPSVLDVVRSIFVYINSEAHRVSEARKILLNDQSVNDICTQELVQLSHANDTSDNPDPLIVPLLFYDWRGDESKHTSQISVKSVVEINNWLKEYILNEDFGRRQKAALKIVANNELNAAYVDNVLKKLTYEQSRLIRERVGSVLLPGLTYLLENFRPYKRYIEKLRILETEQTSSGDIGSHALLQLRFGSNVAPAPILKDVEERKEEIELEVSSIKASEIGSLLQDDIGMRGIVSVFGSLYEKMEPPKDWLKFADWFTDVVNQMFDAGWFNEQGKLGAKHLKHVAFDHNGGRVNYRLDQAAKALGSYVQMIMWYYTDEETDPGKIDWDQIRDEAYNYLNSALLSGYKREVRVLYKDQDEYQSYSSKEFNEAVISEAGKRTNKHIKSFERAVKRSLE